MLGIAIILGEQPDLPEDLFLYVELFDLRISRRPRNSEFATAPFGPRLFRFSFSNSRLGEFLLDSKPRASQAAKYFSAVCVNVILPAPRIGAVVDPPAVVAHVVATFGCLSRSACFMFTKTMSALILRLSW
jgi:hypothetical protein